MAGQDPPYVAWQGGFLPALRGLPLPPGHGRPTAAAGSFASRFAPAATGFGLRASGFRPIASQIGLRATGFGLRARHRRINRKPIWLARNRNWLARKRIWSKREPIWLARNRIWLARKAPAYQPRPNLACARAGEACSRGTGVPACHPLVSPGAEPPAAPQGGLNPPLRGSPRSSASVRAGSYPSGNPCVRAPRCRACCPGAAAAACRCHWETRRR